MPHLGLLTVLVDDYATAIEHYVDDLGFVLVEDTPIGDKRWVVVAPAGADGEPASTHLLLAVPADDRQRARVGDQTGGRVFLFLHTDDFERDRQEKLYKASLGITN